MKIRIGPSFGSRAPYLRHDEYGFACQSNPFLFLRGHVPETVKYGQPSYREVGGFVLMPLKYRGTLEGSKTSVPAAPEEVKVHSSGA